MTKITVRIEGADELAAALFKLADEAGEILHEATLAAAFEFERQAESAAPGPYLTTVTDKVSRNKAVVNVGPDKAHWYYQFFETGAGEHEITPDHKALLFQGKEGAQFARSVQHPGVPMRPFLRNTMDRMRTQLADRIGQVIRRRLEMRWRGG